MKILSLNTWQGGKCGDKLRSFIGEHATHVDVFCFQEAEPRIREIVQRMDEEYESIWDKKVLGEVSVLNLATFVKKQFKILEHGTLLSDTEMAGLGQWVIIDTPRGPFYLCNYHGYAYPGDKLDNTERLRASEVLIDHAQSKTIPALIIGDFNLEKETKSVSLFAENGFQNLIAEYNVPTTRNKLAWSSYPGNEQYYADYAFIKGIDVSNFTVLQDEVSDHLQLLVEV